MSLFFRLSCPVVLEESKFRYCHCIICQRTAYVAFSTHILLR